MDRVLLWLSRNVSVHIYDLGEEDPSLEEVDHNGVTNHDRTPSVRSGPRFNQRNHTEPRRRRSSSSIPNVIIPSFDRGGVLPSHSLPSLSTSSISLLPSVPNSVIPVRSTVTTTTPNLPLPNDSLTRRSSITEIIYDNVLARSHITPSLPTSPIYSLDYYELQYEQQRQLELEQEIGEPVNDPNNIPPLRAIDNVSPNMFEVPLASLSPRSPASPLTSTNLLPRSNAATASGPDRPVRLTKTQRVQLFLLYKTCAVVGPSLATLAWIFQIGVCGRILAASSDTLPANIRNILNSVTTIVLFWSLLLHFLENFLDHHFFRSSPIIVRNRCIPSITGWFWYRISVFLLLLIGTGYLISNILGFQLVNNYKNGDNEIDSNNTVALGYSYVSIMMLIPLLWIIFTLIQIYHNGYDLYTDTNESTVIHSLEESSSSSSNIGILLRSPSVSSSSSTATNTAATRNPIRTVRYKLQPNDRNYLSFKLFADILGWIGNLILLSNTLPYFIVGYWYILGLLPPSIPSSSSSSMNGSDLHTMMQSFMILAYIHLGTGSVIKFLVNLTYLPDLPASIVPLNEDRGRTEARGETNR